MRRKLATVAVIALAGIGMTGCLGETADEAIDSGRSKFENVTSNVELCSALKTETEKMAKDTSDVLSAKVASGDVDGMSESLKQISEAGSAAYTKLAAMNYSPEAKEAFAKFAALYASLNGDDISALTEFAQGAQQISDTLTGEMKRVCTVG